ncbi:MAG: CRISPR-associated protein Cas6, partial [Nitrospirae bacterium]
MRVNYQSFEFVLKPQENIILPAYKGSTFRGGFGNVFRRIVCALKKNDCKDCLLKEKCIYSYVFETPPPAETKVMKKYTAAPHPFIIEPPVDRKRAYTPNDVIKFNLVLVGRALEYLPYFIYTFNELGGIGIGKGRGKYLLEKVSADSKRIYSSETKVIDPFSKITCAIPFEAICDDCSRKSLLTLEFLTPTRVVRNADLVLDLEFDILIRQLLRRIALLAYFHEGHDTSSIDFKGIIE